MGVRLLSHHFQSNGGAVHHKPHRTDLAPPHEWAHRHESGIPPLLPVQSSNLESDVHELSGVIVLILMKRLREEMEIMNTEVLFIGCLRIVTVTDKKNILLNIFLDHKPRTAAKTQTFALSYRVKP